ncbi:DUF1707 SHOCT-like domain-containing protein [Streptomyces fructofermentans]|uniref:Cell wall-active antibiotics response LiaF-like C-terminal domain-containing protein n=1 Tax=Streptomyces fructofermentans TaxID=152141 RepID=A0A918K014_9ACTN|nr:DUF1707 domain-containing protein [Streptomyces fructofermentans]GGX39997.1 hypothetical protein GCM10010515_03250 [Streptomyces fructofermentans]
MDLQKHSEPGLRKHTELRASDADRDRTADILREALAEGRLTADEHAERVEEVFRAKTVGELEPLVGDLPGAHQRRSGAAFSPAPNRPAPGTVPPVADENVVAVFSAAVRRGRWRVGRRTHAYAVFGSVEIDLSEAVFEHQQVVIKAVSVFGNVEIRVPENVSLRGSGGGVLGNFEVDTLDSGDPDAPVVYVDGLAVLGNIEAKPKRGRLIEDLLDRVGGRVHSSLRKHLRH